MFPKQGPNVDPMDVCPNNPRRLKRLDAEPKHPDVDQVSPPMRIALLAVLAFAGLWFVALRPKPPQAAAPAPAPATQTPAKPAATKPATAEVAGARAKPAAAGAKRAAGDQSPALERVLRDVEAKRTVLLLFWDARKPVDREVRRAVAGVDRRGGKVKVHVQPTANVGDFEPITRGVPVVTSPTVLVIGRTGKARAVGGLTQRSELDELAGRALQGK